MAAKWFWSTVCHLQSMHAGQKVPASFQKMAPMTSLHQHCRKAQFLHGTDIFQCNHLFCFGWWQTLKRFYQVFKFININVDVMSTSVICMSRCHRLWFLVANTCSNNNNNNNNYVIHNTKVEKVATLKEKLTSLNWMCPPLLPICLSKWNQWWEQKQFGQHPESKQQ